VALNRCERLSGSSILSRKWNTPPNKALLTSESAADGTPGEPMPQRLPLLGLLGSGIFDVMTSSGGRHRGSVALLPRRAGPRPPLSIA
jgi:hypothetical protein